jgi:hypothetical protein
VHEPHLVTVRSARGVARPARGVARVAPAQADRPTLVMTRELATV